jgi:hypothetical protein
LLIPFTDDLHAFFTRKLDTTKKVNGNEIEKTKNFVGSTFSYKDHFVRIPAS